MMAELFYNQVGFTKESASIIYFMGMVSYFINKNLFTQVNFNLGTSMVMER
jgi:hypothetical protein